MHTEAGRRRGEATWLGPVPLVGDTGEEGAVTGLGLLPREQRVQAAY